MPEGFNPFGQSGQAALPSDSDMGKQIKETVGAEAAQEAAAAALDVSEGKS